MRKKKRMCTSGGQVMPEKHNILVSSMVYIVLYQVDMYVCTVQ